jgi:SNF2 family DNA or RNA helicase
VFQFVCMDLQVMALIAYLMEYKGNYGPHLIIVPNAVMVNWKVAFLDAHF